jgi:hypothetical protein
MQQQEERMINKRKSFVKKTENQEGLPLESLPSLSHLAAHNSNRSGRETKVIHKPVIVKVSSILRTQRRGNNVNLPLLNYVNLKIEYYDQNANHR